MTIWCVEDDKNIRDMEIYTLESTGFAARGFGSGADFRAALSKELPDLVILDIMLPDADGVELLTRLRASRNTESLPVIMATAKGMEYDKIQSLDLGADDYLVKPFGMLEMVSRIKAVLRRSTPKNSSRVLKYSGIILKPAERIVTVDGIKAELTYKEFELLKLFMSNPGTVHTRDELFAAVWETRYYGETRTLDMHIRTLRQKLNKYGKLIKTVRNVGYCMEEDE